MFNSVELVTAVDEVSLASAAAAAVAACDVAVAVEGSSTDIVSGP